MRSYLAIFCTASALAVGSVAALNYVVDPYLIHQWDTPEVHRLGPAREKLSAWGKTYAIARYRPAVLYLGNSRTELALPTNHSAFSGAPVFNAALSGASLGDMVAMARHATAFARLDTVVWGIDAPSFYLEQGTLDFDQGLVANGGAYLPLRTLLDIRRALAFDMTVDSVGVLRGSFGGICRSSLALRGQRDESCVADHMAAAGGTGAVVGPRLGDFIRAPGPTDPALAEFDATLGMLCRAGTRVRIYLNPTHASMHAALWAAGKWNALERWQGQLATVAARRRAAGCDLRLVDFSGFNSITTEPLPQASGRRSMRYYWEPSHYRANVGAMLMQAMFGGDARTAVPRGFGVELTPQSLAMHQLAQRAARVRYLAENPVEAGIIRKVAYAEAMSQARAAALLH